MIGSEICNTMESGERFVLEILNLTVPVQVRWGEAFQVQVQAKVSHRAIKPLAYLAFFRGEELWYVAELGEMPVTLEPGERAEVSLSALIKEDVPEGSYTVLPGIHTFETLGTPVRIRVQGGEFTGKGNYKPLSWGKYLSPKTGRCQLWYVNQNHAMIWNGKPYFPVGGMVCPKYLIFYDKNDPEGNRLRWEQDKRMVRMLWEKGIRHIYLNTNRTVEDCPAHVLEPYFALLEEYGITYGLQISCPTECRQTQYLGIRAASGRISVKAERTGRVETEHVADMVTNGSDSIRKAFCKFIVIEDGSGKAVDSGDGEAEVTDRGTMRYSAVIHVPQGAYTVCFIPWVDVRESQFVDPYRHTDVMARKYRAFAHSFSAGEYFRNFIDILTNESGTVNGAEAARFTGNRHQDAYSQWLREKYKSVAHLNRKWKLGEGVSDFDTAARLIPVYTAETGSSGGNSYAMDINTNALYCVDMNESLLWDDYLGFRQESLGNLNTAAADWMKSTPQTNVPVVYKHVSVLEPYNINHGTKGGFDGIGGEIYGDFDTAAAKRSYPFAEAEQSARTMWYIITECNTNEDVEEKYKAEPWVYPTKEYMHRFFQEHLEDGARGIYDFVAFGDFFPTLNAYSYHSRPQAYAWSREFREYVEQNAEEIAGKSGKDGGKRCYFYPAAQSWWYCPNKREAALTKTDYRQTRIFWFGENLVYQTFDPQVPKDMLFVNLEDAPATKVWGEHLNQYLARKPEREIVVYLGLRRDRGAIPAIDRYFADEPVEMESGNSIQRLHLTETAQSLAQTEDGKVWALRDGSLYIIANTAWNRGEAENSQYTHVRLLELIETK